MPRRITSTAWNHKRFISFNFFVDRHLVIVVSIGAAAISAWQGVLMRRALTAADYHRSAEAAFDSLRVYCETIPSVYDGPDILTFKPERRYYSSSTIDDNDVTKIREAHFAAERIVTDKIITLTLWIRRENEVSLAELAASMVSNRIKAAHSIDDMTRQNKKPPRVRQMFLKNLQPHKSICNEDLARLRNWIREHD